MKGKNYHTVGTVPKTTTLLEQFQKLPHCWNSSTNYHTVGTVPQTTTLLEQFQKLPHCWNSSKILIKIAERGKIDTLSTQIHDRTPSCLGTGTSIKSGGIKLFL
jgi:hypothetical protein